MNLRIFETVQECIAARFKCATVRKMGPLVTGRCSLLRSRLLMLKDLRSLNLLIVKKPDIGRVLQSTNILVVEANGRFRYFLAAVWNMGTR